MGRSILAVILVLVLANHAYAMGSLFGGGGGGGGSSATASTGGAKNGSGTSTGNDGNTSNTAGGTGSSAAANSGGVNNGGSTSNSNSTASGSGFIECMVTPGPPPSSVPEPSLMILLASGGLLIWYAKRRTRE